MDPAAIIKCPDCGGKPHNIRLKEVCPNKREIPTKVITVQYGSGTN
jgi:hypothetical protein